MSARVCRNHHHADRKHDEPAIIDAHGDPVNARDHNLPFEKGLEVHVRRQRAKRKELSAKGKRNAKLLDASESWVVPLHLTRRSRRFAVCPSLLALNCW